MVFLKLFNQQTLALNLDPNSTTLGTLIDTIQQKLGIPHAYQRKFLSSRLIIVGDSAGASLASLGVQRNSTLTLNLPLLGGMQPPSIPPANYVAGLGRGATGFITRSDIGSRARTAPGGVGVGRGRVIGDEEEFDDADEEKWYDHMNHKFDEFEGDDVGLFASSVAYDEDDMKADAVWEEIDNKMDLRRKDRREARLKQEIDKYKASNPKISEQFADLKRKLHLLSTEEWDSIPEIGGYSSRNKKKRRFESFVPVPDTLLEKARQEKEHVTALDPKSRAAGGTETPWAQTINLTAVGEGRERLLSLKLDKLSDSVSGFTVVDPKGYLTDLNRMKISSDAEISDIKKARLLLMSVIKANPKHPSGWIAAARLEEVAGKISVARQLISKGCEECSKSEDVWLEACRLSSLVEAKAVIAKGVKANPNSVRLWMQAAKLEKDEEIKSRVLRKGLEQVPYSVRLWKAVVELASEENARVLLRRAVECCPLHVELWLALARLETYDSAKKVLIEARKKLPKEPAIWITAAKLEEANGKTAMVGNIIERGIKDLQKEGVRIDREAWMREAEAAERAGSVLTCNAIISRSIGIGFEVEGQRRAWDAVQAWVAEAEECEERGSIETARAIYDHACTVLTTDECNWIKAAMLEKTHGTRESLDALLRKAISYQQDNEKLWLLAAEEKRRQHDVAAARLVFRKAYAAMPWSTNICLAQVKLEYENSEFERARLLLAKARGEIDVGEVWMESALLEKKLGNTSHEKDLLVEGLKHCPSFFELWLMFGQLLERQADLEGAVKTYNLGLRKLPDCIPLWLSLAKLEEKKNGLSNGRAVLAMARNKNPQIPDLWLAAVQAESRHGLKKEADILMTKALQECPKSGILWAASIEMVPRHQRKRRSQDALKKCGNDPHVIAAIAKLFWHDRKVEQARKWMNSAVTLGPSVGDFWALYYKFELENGSAENQMDVLKRCIAAKPKHGEKWQSISKLLENSHQPTDLILKKVASILLL